MTRWAVWSAIAANLITLEEALELLRLELLYRRAEAASSP
jgi:hypothetical protein